MYKNFVLTESEREEILNKHKASGYKKTLSEQAVAQPQGAIQQKANDNNQQFFVEALNNGAKGIFQYVSQYYPGYVVSLQNQILNNTHSYRGSHTVKAELFQISTNTMTLQIALSMLLMIESKVDTTNTTQQITYQEALQLFNQGQVKFVETFSDKDNLNAGPSLAFTLLVPKMGVEGALKTMQQAQPQILKPLLQDIQKQYNDAAQAGNSTVASEYKGYLDQLSKNQINEQQDIGGVNDKAQADIFKKYPQGGQTQQPKPQTTTTYRVGQILKGTRDLDGKVYIIKVMRVGQGWIVGSITGPGKYGVNPLVRTQLELNTNEPGKLSGNQELGTFTISQ